MIQPEINNIRILVSKNRISEAIGELNNIILNIKDKNLRNSLIVRSANYSQFEREGILGTNDNNTERNRIVLSILEIIDEIETNYSLTENLIIKSLADDDSSINNLVSIFEKEITSLDERSTKEDLQKIDNIRHKLFDNIFGKFDHKIKFDISVKSKFSQIVFDKVYSNDLIDEITRLDIIKIREDKKNYTWIDRSTIVYALSLSSIQAKKFDPSRISLLLDFMSDFEENVWQRALVGLVLSLLINNNKWQRFDYLKKRLLTLQTIDDVQEGLHSIELILRREYYKLNFFNKNIFEIDYFIESPLNYFLPFYEDNPIIDYCVNRMTVDNVDYEELLRQVSNLPYIDSYKYLLFWGLTDGTTERIDKSNNEKPIQFLTQILTLSDSFFPYHNLISEYYFFYKYFPAKYIDEFISNQTSIYSTKLKDVILNNVNKLILLADSQMSEKKIKGAIHSLEEAMKISSNREDIRYNLATCYMNDKQYKKAEKHFIDLSSNSPEDVKIKLNLGICFKETNKKKEAEDCFEFVFKRSPQNLDNLIVYADLKDSQRDFDNALRLLLAAEKIQPSNINIMKNIGDAYGSKQDFDNALIYYLKIKELGPSNKWRNTIDIADTYMNLNSFDLALSYANKAIDLKPKDWYSWVMRGRVYLSSILGLEKAQKDILHALSIKKEDIVYGNLGHIFLCLGKREKAIEAYKECVLKFDDIEEFIIKYNLDTKFVTLHGLPEEEYISIREEVVNYWKSNFKK